MKEKIWLLFDLKSFPNREGVLSLSIYEIFSQIREIDFSRLSSETQASHWPPTGCGGKPN